jgi:pimeloyl-ACP methyl ester carboxylesterase/putative sterol carrier protein
VAVAKKAPLAVSDEIRMRVMTLPARFRRDAANGLTAEVELVVDDEPFTVSIVDGDCFTREGPSAGWTTRVVADTETWLAIDEGRTNGMDAFLARRVHVRGNLDLAVRMQSLFDTHGRPRGPMDIDQVDVDADGIRVSTYVFGNPLGSPILMLHGLGGTKVSLAPLFSRLAPTHRLIVPDLPGHGETEKPKTDYTPRWYARVARKLMDAVEVERAVVLGNSLGGRVALEMAVRAPSRVRGLVLLAPAVPGFRIQPVLGFMRVIPTEVGRIPFPLRERWMQVAVRRLFGDPSVLPDEGYQAAADEFIRVYRDPAARMAFFGSLRHLVTEAPKPFWAQMRKVRVPALLVWGTADRLVPVRLAPRLAEAMPRSELMVLDGAGHVPQFEATEAVLERMVPFVTSLDA